MSLYAMLKLAMGVLLEIERHLFNPRDRSVVRMCVDVLEEELSYY